MLNRIRPRSVYDVLAAIACFGVLAGGTAYASHLVVNSSDVVDESLLSQDIKNGEVKSADIANGAVLQTKLGANAVSTGKVIDNSMTGNDIAESTLVGVNADKVDGLNAARIHQVTTCTQTFPIVCTPPGEVEVLNMGGLQLRLVCTNSDFYEPKLIAATFVDDSMIRSRAMPDFSSAVDPITDDDFDTNGTTPGDEKTIYENSQGSGLINYMSATGNDVTVQYMVDGFEVPASDDGGCSISGTAFQGGP